MDTEAHEFQELRQPVPQEEVEEEESLLLNSIEGTRRRWRRRVYCLCSVEEAIMVMLSLCDFRSIMSIFFTYGVCTFGMLSFWIVLTLFDMALDTRVSECLIQGFYQNFHGFVLPTLKMLNALFGLFIGLVILNHVHDLSWQRHTTTATTNLRSSRSRTRKARGAGSLPPPQIFDRRGIKALKTGISVGQMQKEKEEEKEEECCCCCICLDSIAAHDMVSIVMNCRHYFHAACIHKWLSLSANCPLCRTPAAFTVVTFNC